MYSSRCVRSGMLRASNSVNVPQPQSIMSKRRRDAAAAAASGPTPKRLKLIEVIDVDAVPEVIDLDAVIDVDADDGDAITLADSPPIQLPSGPPPGSYEARVRDKVFQRLEAQKSKIGEVAEVGIIESLYMENFMCHDRLALDLGPKLNLICGANGSGKSAALSALQIGLASKTTSAGRGGSLKTYIKEGKTYAVVRVTIKNQGEDAYRADVYGSRIIVERRFTAEGASSFKIFGTSDTGERHSKAVSTHRSELKAICDHMNIQVDNPLNILTQDNARQFLAASRPDAMYDFFIEGTQLGQLSRDYIKSQDGIHQFKRTCDAHRDNVVADAKASLEEALLKLDVARKAKNLHDEKEELQRELAWAYVHDERQKVEEATKPLKKCRKRIEQMEKELQKAQAACDDASKQLTALRAQIPSFNPADEESATLRHKITDMKRDLDTLDADIKACNADKDASDRRIADLQARIAKENEKLEGATQKVMEDFQTRLSQKQEDIKRSEEGVDRAKRAVDTLEAKREQAIAAGKTATEEKARAQDEIQRLQQAIRNAEQQQKDALAVFGPNTANILEDIKKTQWHGSRAPIGPLGMHVELVDPTYGSAIRNLLGRVLFGYAVADLRDMQRLRQILARHRSSQVTIAITDVDVFDYSAGEPDEGVPTILRALKVKDDWILRVLINAHRIEAFGLAENLHAGHELLNRVGKLQRVLTRDERRILRFPGGGWETNAMRRLLRNDPRQMLLKSAPEVQDDLQCVDAANVAESERQADENARTSQTQLEAINRSLSAARNTLQQRGRDLSAHRNQLLRIKEEAKAAAPVNISGLEDAVTKEEADGDSLVAQFTTLVQRRKEVEDTLLPLVQQLPELRNRQQLVEETVHDARRKLNEAVEFHAEKEKNVQYWTAKQRTEKKTLEELEPHVDALSKQLKDWTANASLIVDEKEFPRPRPIKELETRIEVLKKAVAAQEREQGATFDEINRQVIAAREKLGKENDKSRILYEICRALESSLRLRESLWFRFRRGIAIRCKWLFQVHLHTRAFEGKAIFNHEDATLELRVHPANSEDHSPIAKGKRRDDPKTLSGGEKSFSTICWLLALWDALACPLRCLDEFDVFMDAVNRRVSMRMMMDAAKASDQRQHILISPLGLENLAYSQDTKVFKMDDPTRQQAI
ncbi:P-loop containing nucleoside triphosphate hydrolase protein [Exidia glandulosa HHB12029]|uniref:p-loop containing nucleoside triphosphate hydrolase protein n=1 Tax=Exidia glandulosa HHB12029 TaxID=1314781 RepID=A0A165BBY3_EXIGL|nr:P-loop containing nucleoside triphosphate hydrolase protein [Exidia glandulosa HHB12029]